MYDQFKKDNLPYRLISIHSPSPFVDHCIAAAVGSFPHISAGWCITYDLSEPPLKRLQTIAHNNNVLDLADESVRQSVYLVSISDFYVDKGGDGVDIFTTQEIVSEHRKLVAHCVVDYLDQYVDVLCGDPPGRFTCITRN